MDFQNLLKQAASNQATKQKQFASSKQIIDTEKNITKIKKLENEKKTKQKLKQFEESVIKSRMEYHGISAENNINSSVSPSTSKAIKNKNTVESSKTLTTKAYSPKKSKKLNTMNVKSSSQESSTTPSRKVRSRELNPPKLPTDFHELLKLAKQNSHAEVTWKSSTQEHVKGIGLKQDVDIGKSLMYAQEHVKGIGSKQSCTNASTEKSLMHKQEHVKGIGSKQSPTDVSIGKSLLHTHCKSSPVTVIKSSRSMSSSSKVKLGVDHSIHQQEPKKQEWKQIEDRKNEIEASGNVKTIPYPRPYPKLQHFKQKKDVVPNGENKAKANMCTYGEPQFRDDSVKSVHFKNKNRINTGRPLSNAAKSRNPNKFYSASARLLTDNRSGSSSGLSMMGYRSTWADQMSEYLRNNQYEFEDEDEDEIDDFVVDDVECEDEFNGDYSSAIRNIFGDRYLKATDSIDDTEVMESSFAQQEFEEIRSARIGRLEDEEDIRREKEMTDRKRKHKHINTVLKSKHSKF